MNETTRIAKLFQDLYQGSPWIDVNLVDILHPLSHEQAARRVIPGLNTIWEIVNHLIDWRLNVLKRVQGEVLTTPSHNYFFPVEEITETAWQLTLDRLEDSQQQWLKLLENFDEDTFERLYPNNGLNFYEHIQGIIQHDAYHLGQIVLLAKVQG